MDEKDEKYEKDEKDELGPAKRGVGGESAARVKLYVLRRSTYMCCSLRC